MKQLRKRIVAVICVVAMLGGIVFQNGIALDTKAADSATATASATDEYAREWWVYGDDEADTGLVVADTANGVTANSISDAGVNLPDGLIEANMELHINLTVEGTDIATLNGSGACFELSNELNDCAELSWVYQNFVSGDNNISFAFKDAAHTNGTAVNGKGVQDGKSPFDWQETIDYFRCYQQGSPSDIKITVNEIKIVYTDTGLTFGEDDTYLQLDSAMSATPNAVEATINMPRSIGTTYWTLRAGSDTTTTSGHTLATGTTVEGDAPGAGLAYSILDATSGAQTFTTNNYGFNIDGSAYGKSQLAVAFWVYASEAGSLTASGDNQMRISSSTDGLGANFLYYPLQDITVSAGWNYISLPLDTWNEVADQPFDISNIYRIGFTPFMLATGSYRYLCDIELVVIESESGSDDAEETPSWTLRLGSDTTTTSGHTLTTGTTAEGAEPGAGLTYSIWDATSGAQTFTTDNYGLNIDASAYEKSELAVAFWVYSSEAGSLTASGDNQMRISSSTDGLGANFLYYSLQTITVKAGWNYISLPLDEWNVVSGQDFDLSNIYRIGFTPFMLSEGSYRYLCDIELIVLAKEEAEEVTEWEIFTASTVENASPSFSTGTTTASDAPGEGMQYMILDSVSSFGTRNSNLGIDAGSYKLEELAVAFWVYSSNAGTLGTGDNFRLGNVTYLGETPFLYYMYGDITVEAGWNYIELPLNEWKQEQGSGFSTAKLNCFGFTNYNPPSGEKRYFGDFKIVVLGADSSTVVEEGNIEVTKNISEVADNHMILSNANAESESNPCALYVTDSGYPAVLYGTTQFVLKQNIATGNDVNIKAVVNASKQVEFYVDGSLVATSQTTVSGLGAPSTAYSIGADGAGAQTFVGTIKDVKTYSDAAATACTGNWPLVGDTNYVVETMPDVSGNGNNATFKGTRANDWYDVEAIGEDDWSLVFIPDIVQRFYAGEHATWHKMAKWIGDNIESENIKYVIGAKTADSAQASAMNNGYEFFDNAVATTNYNTATENSYYRFQVNGVKWMILSLKQGWDADATAVFTWGKEIIAKYPNDNVIITCDNYYDSIWSEFNNDKGNVKLIVYGSQPGTPSESAPVMNFPAQNDAENSYFGEQGLGLMYMLRFTEGGTKVTARSYAPIYDSYFTGVVNYEKTIDTVKAPEAMTVKYTGATPRTAPTDVPVGYLFSGWFTASGIVEEWTLHEGQYFGPNGGASMTPGSYVTTAEDEPGEGMTCFVLDASSQGITFDGFQHQDEAIDVSAYSKDELAISFWVHSNQAGQLDPGPDGGQLRLACSNDIYTFGNFIYYPMREIDIQEGWNYVEVPLSDFNTEAGENFSLSAITTWGIMNTHTVPAGTILKYCDIKLVRYGADCSAESALKEATTGTVYARFVDADMLTVRGQITANTSDKSNYSNIRFVTSVDRLEYKRMGFKIAYTGTDGSAKTKDIESRYVYTKLYAVGAHGTDYIEYEPSKEFSPSATYFKAYTINNVPNQSFNTDFSVQPYWITLDGTTVYGEKAAKNVWMGYPTNEEFLPKIVTTTYATDDVVIADVVLTEPKYGYVTADDVANKDYDWSTALQNALNDVHNKGGGTVYVPSGQYKLTKSILIPSDVTLRGDWQDPDEGTAYGTIFNIYPTQELAGANRNADSVHNADTNGDGYSDVAAFVMTGSSGVVGITAYYPEQSLSDVKEYPYTFYVTVGNDGGQLITLKNITVINGYRGIGTRYETQHEALIVDNFKGTFLDCGMAIYNSSDTGTISNVSISSEYWANSSLGAVDASTYVLANATAMELGDLEWHQLSNCSVDGYKVGISIVGGYRTNFAGSMIDMSITGCATGLTIAAGNDATYYAGSDVDRKDAYPLNRALDPRWGLVIARSTIEGTTNAIVNNTEATLENKWQGISYRYDYATQTSALLRLTDVDITGSVVENEYTGYRNNYTYNVMGDDDTTDLSSYDAQYDATYTITDAQKKNLWVVELQNYSADDIENNMHEIINAESQKLLARNSEGGILYIPGGTYKLYGAITVPAGVELHGASSVANREQYIDGEGTLFMVYYGDDDTNTTTDTALVTLAGDNSGISGIRFLYPENVSVSAEDAASQTFSSTYAIAAKDATNVHVTNCFIAASSYGVNLQNCDEFHVENLFTCAYRNTINVDASTGVIRDCWTNPNAIARTTAEGLPEEWPEEAKYDNETAPINVIRNYLKDTLTFIQVSGSTSDVLIHNVTAFAHNRSVVQSGGNVLVINSNADSLDNANGVQFELTGGTMKVINALRAAITDNGSSQDASLDFLYTHTAGTLSIYNSIMAKSTEANSAYEDNTSATK